MSLAPHAAPSGVTDAPRQIAHVREEDDGLCALDLMVEGVHCGGCVARIERMLGAMPGIESARVNLSTRRLAVRWRRECLDPSRIVEALEGIGFRAVPFDPTRLAGAVTVQEKALLRAMAVAGFGAANVMLLSVSVWAGHVEGMDATTRDLFHWISALIALPTVAYAGRPFFASAWRALKVRRTNMDVPISLAILLASGMSLHETAAGAEHAYFDAAVMLLFFLLVGRYLDSRSRGRARSAAENLVGLGAASVTVLDEDGTARTVAPEEARKGMTVAVAAGERIGVDGTVTDGSSDVDASLITGESVPRAVAPGEPVFAGTVNLTGPLRVRVTQAGEGTLLAEIARLMAAAEQGRGRFVALADRVARLYAPVVHSLALLAFLGWVLVGGMAWQPALMIAVAVLIITCPCALGLAVPAVQVIASGRLFRRGILLKSATALERLAEADTVAFDKTGTLTAGRPRLDPAAAVDGDALRLAAGIAAASRHPLARALVAASPAVAVANGVRELPGFGLAWDGPGGEVRLGSRRWCGVAAEDGDAAGPELWLARPGRAPLRFAFQDEPRPDAAAVADGLSREGYRLTLLSGDRAAVARRLAAAVGIADWHAPLDPAGKVARLGALSGEGRRVVMVGDGINDAPALAAAHVSMSPSTAAEVSQTAADVVFQGERLAPVAEVLDVARRANGLIRQNLALALAYNLFAVPLAMAGLVTPLIAAAAMSTSSILVVGNSLRLSRRGRRP